MNIDEILAGEGGLILDGNQANFLRGYLQRMQEDERSALAAIVARRQELEAEKQSAWSRLQHEREISELKRQIAQKQASWMPPY